MDHRERRVNSRRITLKENQNPELKIRTAVQVFGPLIRIQMDVVLRVRVQTHTGYASEKESKLHLNEL